MSLSALHHRRLATTSPATNGITDVLNAIWTAVQPSVTTYADGTTRTAGTGTAWTWTRYQAAGVTQAVYGTPPTGSLAQRVLFVGATANPTPTPTMLIDVWSNNRLHIGLVKNAGAFNAWNAASPFTTGHFTGYTQIGATLTTPVAITIFESEETVQIAIGIGTAGALHGAGAGAIIDPDTGDAADGETDGRIYGIWTVGSGTFSTMLTNAATNTFMNHGASSTNSHFVTFAPGNGTIVPTTRENFYFSITAAQRTTRAGKFPGTPLYVTSTSNWVGRVREIRVIRPAIFGQRLDTTPGTIKGYVYAQSTSTNGDSVLLEY
jgi:hypothetical protein